MTANNRRARMYRLTRLGHKQLIEQEKKWLRLSDAVGTVLRFAQS